MIEDVLSGVPDRPSKQAVIGACSILNPLAEHEIDALMEHCQMAYAERGEAIWIAGAPSDFVAVVGTGFVKMTRTAPQGAEIAVELLGPGQCFGLLAALEGRIFPLSAVAVTHCWYLKAPTRILQELYKTNQHLRDQMLRALGPRLRRAHEMMARLSSGKVEQRIAAVLLILGESYGRTGRLGGVRLNVPLTRQDIAEMAGTTVETCIRVMSRWQKAEIVTTDHQVITLRKPDALNAALID
jgi:CRP-like cAMP-binding protein